LSLQGRVGAARVFLQTQGSYNPDLGVTVKQDGKPLAHYSGLARIPLLPGRYSLELEPASGDWLRAGPITVPEFEAYRDIERSLDVPFSSGSVAVMTPGRSVKVKFAPAGQDHRTVLDGWSNRLLPALPGAYDVWIDTMGWVRGLQVGGGQITVVRK
jgi:hypothetical protein